MRYKAEEIKINIDKLIKTKPREAIISKLSLEESLVKNFTITRRSLDSRFHESSGIFYIFNVEFDYPKKIKSKSVKPADKDEGVPEAEKITKDILRPVIVGGGPAGLFAALRLVEAGVCPILIERGKDMQERAEDVNLFWNGGELDEESNVQFGLGGAGAFSDGKLNSRIKSPYTRYVAGRLVNFGAKYETMYSAKPHLGTDKIRIIVSDIKAYLEEKGVDFYFGEKLTSIEISDGKVCAAITNNNRFETNDIFLAIGNSARDTFEMLYEKGVAIQAKPFAVGVRVEHPAEVINEYVYGSYVGHPLLKNADYLLKYHDDEYDRNVYSFCNCPGGFVINASSEKERLAINGMSYSKRNAKNTNSAIVVQVGPKDFGEHPLDGVRFARELEEKAFELGGGDYSVPYMSIGEFIGNDDEVDTLPTPRPICVYEDLNEIFPDFVKVPLKNALMSFAEKIEGFDRGVMSAVESRTSSPVRIPRTKDTYESINTKNLYPIGEGAGYSGGIMSSAVDGVKAVDRMIAKYNKEEAGE
ncbi:MAG: hypothetical protein E7218_01970 [Anaerofustis stercorihominis]|nr:hypothetical protein [Anaerofustis stercorihominis]